MHRVALAYAIFVIFRQALALRQWTPISISLNFSSKNFSCNSLIFHPFYRSLEIYDILLLTKKVEKKLYIPQFLRKLRKWESTDSQCGWVDSQNESDLEILKTSSGGTERFLMSLSRQSLVSSFFR